MFKPKSEFGAGLSYCLGNFIAHESHNITDYSTWFNAAADHLFDLQPDNLPTNLRNRFFRFRSRCLDFRLPMDDKRATKKDYLWATKEARNLLIEIDKLLGLKPVRGRFE